MTLRKENSMVKARYWENTNYLEGQHSAGEEPGEAANDPQILPIKVRHRLPTCFDTSCHQIPSTSHLINGKGSHLSLGFYAWGGGESFAASPGSSPTLYCPSRTGQDQDLTWIPLRIRIHMRWR